MKNDARYLYEDYGIHVECTFDLRFMAAMNGLLPSGLAKMSLNHLSYKLSKNQQVSKWNAPKLSDKQIDYAARDAHISIKLFKFFVKTQTGQEYYEYDVKEHCQQYFNLYFNHHYHMQIYHLALAEKLPTKPY